MVDLGLGLARFVGDRGFDAVTLVGCRAAALFDVRRLVSHPLHQLQQLCVLVAAGEGRDFLGGGLGGLREPRGLPPAFSSRWVSSAIASPSSG